jgi:hypothetical protein
VIDSRRQNQTNKSDERDATSGKVSRNLDTFNDTSFQFPIADNLGGKLPATVLQFPERTGTHVGGGLYNIDPVLEHTAITRMTRLNKQFEDGNIGTDRQLTAYEQE